MARLAAIAKGLYYPTPLRMVELIAEHIQVYGVRQGGVVLDPCCGTGEAVKRLVDVLNMRFHTDGWFAQGIELSEARTNEAKEILGKMNVVNAALEQISEVPRRSQHADILFLNPPYDIVGGQREEIRFLRMALPFLNKDNGVLIYIVPRLIVEQQKWREQVRNLLWRRGFQQVFVRRFLDPEYEQFNQVVVFASHSRGWIEDDHFASDRVLGDLDRTLRDGTGTYYNAYRVREGGVASLSRYGQSTKPDRVPIMRAYEIMPKEPIYQSMEDLEPLYPIIGRPGQAHQDMQPLVPMGAPHAAMVAAAGILNGMILQYKGEDVALRGSYYKRIVTAKETDNEGREVTTHTERPVARLALLHKLRPRITILDSIDHRDDYEDFMLENAKTLVDETIRRFPPQISQEMIDAWLPIIEKKIRAPRPLKGHFNGPFAAQANRIAVLAEGFKRHHSLILDGEMSVGKTMISLATMALSVMKRRPKNRNIVVMIPPQDDLLLKWKYEAENVLKEFNPLIVCLGLEEHGKMDGTLQLNKRPWSELDKAMEHEGLTVILVKSTTAKESTGWEPLQLVERKHRHLVYAHSTTPPVRMYERHKYHIVWHYLGHGLCDWSYYQESVTLHCPLCGEDMEAWHVDNKAEFAPFQAGLQAGKRKMVCPACGLDYDEETETRKENGKGQLWQATRDRYDNAKWPVARYMRSRYPMRYALVIDEAHQAKSLDTNISYAVQDLCSGAWKVLQMTGTLLNGMASSAFRLLFRASATVRHLYSYSEWEKFVTDYGLWQQTERLVEDTRGHSRSGYRMLKSKPKEIPGIAPTMALMLLPSATFLSLDDLELDMVSYAEHTLFVPDDEVVHYKDMVPETEDGITRLVKKEVDGPLGRKIRKWIEAVKSNAVKLKKEGMGNSGISQYAQARIGITNVLHLPDTAAEVPWEPLILKSDRVLKKEEALIRLLLGQKARGRTTICYVGQIHRRDPTGRLIRLLKLYGLKGVVMKSTQSNRVAWLWTAVKNGADVVFCSPGLVATGLDLVMFCTVVWWNPDYNMYTMSQANRRIWRLQQERDCEVYYLAYNGLPEAQAFHWISRKMQAQQATRGDIRSGLARLMGEDTFITQLQDAVVDEIVMLDSDLMLDSLPAMVKWVAPEKPKRQVLQPQDVKVVTNGDQGKLFEIDRKGTITYNVVVIKGKSGTEVKQFSMF